VLVLVLGLVVENRWMGLVVGWDWASVLVLVLPD
jgi:hypothetical protein